MAELKLMPRQMEVLRTPATEILYGGAAGGGKSYLLRALSIIVAIEVPNIQIYLFRRIFKELMFNHIHTPDGYPFMLREFINDGLVKWNKTELAFDFQNGSRINLCHCQYESDLDTYQGASIGLLLVDEATHFTEKMIRFLRSRLRIGGMEVPDAWKHKIPMALYCSNPGGIGHTFFLNNFVKRGSTPWTTPPSEGGMLRQFISAKLADNIILMENDPNYADKLRGLGSTQLVDAMLDGSWDLPDTQALPGFSEKTHVVKSFSIPASWKIKRGYDYGFSAPYSVLWEAIADDEAFLDGDGEWRSVPKGSIFIILELYGANEYGEGLKEQVSTTAKKILALEGEYGIRGRVRPGPADNSIFNQEQGPSIAEKMSNEGVKFERSNKKPGSRINGLALINQMVQETLKDAPETPCLYVFSRCVHLIDHLINLSRDKTKPEDVDTKGIDHDYDVLRYFALDASKTPKVIGYEGF